MKAKNIDIIKQSEGLNLESYRCPANVLTIGYGHTKNVKSGQKITIETAEKYLIEDITEAENDVNALPVKLSQSQFDALVSIVFNIGGGNFKMSGLRRKIIKNPNDPDIANEFRKWVYIKGIVSKGLTKRRENEINLYFML